MSRFDDEHKYCYLSLNAAQEVGTLDNSNVDFDHSGDLADLGKVVAYHSEDNPAITKFIVSALLHILYNRNLIGDVELEEMLEDWEDSMLDLYELYGSN